MSAAGKPEDVWDPYEGCPRVTRTPAGDVRIKWIFQAIALVVYLSEAYAKVRNNVTDYASLLNSINQSLAEIKKELDQINAKIDLLNDYIKELPVLIRGQIDAALVAQALGECSGILGTIKDYSIPGVIDTEYQTVDGLANQLYTKVNGIIGIQGLAASIIVAPYLSGWLSAKVLVQKTKQRLNPNVTIINPWSSSFMSQSKDNFERLFQAIEAQDMTFRQVTIPAMPRHLAPLKISPVDGTFVWSGRPPEIGAYRLKCPQGIKENVQQALPALPHFPQPPGLPGGGIPFEWRDVDFADPGNREAGKAYTRYSTTRSEIVSFYKAMPELLAIKAETLNVFVEPQGMWQTT
jgi:hypothetical protein